MTLMVRGTGQPSSSSLPLRDLTNHSLVWDQQHQHRSNHHDQHVASRVCRTIALAQHLSCPCVPSLMTPRSRSPWSVRCPLIS